MMVGSFEARVERCGGRKKIGMRWRYKVVKRTSKVHAGSDPACCVARYVKTTEDENKKRKNGATY
jgi:hypothetical protein